MAEKDAKGAVAKVDEKAGKPGEKIVVRGPEDGRWRAGRHFGPIDVEIDLSTLTAAELAAIEGDPKLSVKRF